MSMVTGDMLLTMLQILTDQPVHIGSYKLSGLVPALADDKDALKLALKSMSMCDDISIVQHQHGDESREIRIPGVDAAGHQLAMASDWADTGAGKGKHSAAPGSGDQGMSGRRQLYRDDGTYVRDPPTIRGSR
jgi:hypothetical protein